MSGSSDTSPSTPSESTEKLSEHQEPPDPVPVQPEVLVTLQYLIRAALASIALFFASALYTKLIDWTFPECSDPNCYNYANELLKSIDYSVNPCEDFFSFVCNGWLDNYPLTTNNFVLLQSLISSAMLTSVQEHKTKATIQNAIDKAVLGFRECLEIVFQQDDYTSSIKTFLERFNLTWPKTTKKTHVQLFELLVELSFDWNINIILEITIEPNLKKKGQVILTIGPSSEFFKWYLLRIQYFGDTEFQKYIILCADLVGGSSDYSGMAERIIPVDNLVLTALAVVSLNEVSDSTMYMTFKDLDSIMHRISGRSFLRIINKRLPPENQLSEDDELYCPKLLVLKLVDSLLRSQEEMTLGFYIGFHIVHYLSYMTSFTLVKFVYQSPAYSSEYIIRKCYEDVNESFTHALGALFIQKWLSENIISNVGSLVSAIRQTLVKSFEKHTWMDNRTKQGAIHKVKTLKEIIGRLSYLTTMEDINKHYSYVPDFEGPYLDTKLQLNHARSNYLKGFLTKKNTTIRREDLHLISAQVNAFYLPIYHLIVIPPGILFPPFYVESYSKSITYGSLGHIIGHEIGHAFDPFLSLFDETGRISQWYTNDSRVRFKKRLQCLTDVYNTAPWMQNINSGERALSENFADAAGLQMAYAAYKQLMDSLHADKIPLFGFNSDELFFISSCFKWCGRDTGTDIGPYAPLHLRCNVPLLNLPAFAKTFRCTQGNLMVSKRQCDFIKT